MGGLFSRLTRRTGNEEKKEKPKNVRRFHSLRRQRSDGETTNVSRSNTLPPRTQRSPQHQQMSTLSSTDEMVLTREATKQEVIQDVMDIEEPVLRVQSEPKMMSQPPTAKINEPVEEVEVVAPSRAVILNETPLIVCGTEHAVHEPPMEEFITSAAEAIDKPEPILEDAEVKEEILILADQPIVPEEHETIESVPTLPVHVIDDEIPINDNRKTESSEEHEQTEKPSTLLVDCVTEHFSTVEDMEYVTSDVMNEHEIVEDASITKEEIPVEHPPIVGESEAEGVEYTKASEDIEVTEAVADHQPPDLAVEDDRDIHEPPVDEATDPDEHEVSEEVIISAEETVEEQAPIIDEQKTLADVAELIAVGGNVDQLEEHNLVEDVSTFDNEFVDEKSSLEEGEVHEVVSPEECEYVETVPTSPEEQPSTSDVEEGNAREVPVSQPVDSELQESLKPVLLLTDEQPTHSDLDEDGNEMTTDQPETLEEHETTGADGTADENPTVAIAEVSEVNHTPVDEPKPSEDGEISENILDQIDTGVDEKVPTGDEEEGRLDEEEEEEEEEGRLDDNGNGNEMTIDQSETLEEHETTGADETADENPTVAIAEVSEVKQTPVDEPKPSEDGEISENILDQIDTNVDEKVPTGYEEEGRLDEEEERLDEEEGRLDEEERRLDEEEGRLDEEMIEQPTTSDVPQEEGEQQSAASLVEEVLQKAESELLDELSHDIIPEASERIECLNDDVHHSPDGQEHPVVEEQYPDNEMPYENCPPVSYEHLSENAGSDVTALNGTKEENMDHFEEEYATNGESDAPSKSIRPSIDEESSQLPVELTTEDAVHE